MWTNFTKMIWFTSITPYGSLRWRHTVNTSLCTRFCCLTGLPLELIVFHFAKLLHFSFNFFRPLVAVVFFTLFGCRIYMDSFYALTRHMEIQYSAYVLTACQASYKQTKMIA